ncbi:Male sterility, NAD-binding domain protein [Candidatus Magnetoovum chiemensis]|nr:Male sterility, NAD-binding domain protein [Candidatus Magnetoovum chiemensis]
MKFFITGATGYVGSNLISKLLSESHEITCLIREPDKYVNNDLFKNADKQVK